MSRRSLARKPLDCRCGRPINRKTARSTRVGLLCRKCADRLPRTFCGQPASRPLGRR